MSDAPSQSSPPPLEYAASAAAGPATRRVDVRETPDGLTIIMPPRRLWAMLLPRALLAVGAAGLFAFLFSRIALAWGRGSGGICAGLVLLFLAGVAGVALWGVVNVARTGNLSAVLQVSPSGLLLEDPSAATSHGRARRWRRDEIGYVYVQRSAITATLGFDVVISVIRPGVGNLEHVYTLHTRQTDLHRKLELLINRHLHTAGGGDPSALPVIPVKTSAT